MRASICLAIALVLCPAGILAAAEVETVPESIPEKAEDAKEALGSDGEVRFVPGVEPNLSPRDKRIMRDLDREYEAGGLSRTEYIQRKRELKALEE